MSGSSNNTNCCQPSYPALPDPTINVTNITLGSTTGILRQELYVVADLTGASSDTLTLAHNPVTHASVSFYINGNLQRQGIDYQIGGQTIILTPATLPAGATWNFIFTYMSTDSTTSQDGITLFAGMTTPWEGSVVTIPVGWLLEDGSAVSQVTYPLLFGAIGHKHRNNAADETAQEAATPKTFRLANWNAEFHKVPNTVLVPTIIYTGAS